MSNPEDLPKPDESSPSGEATPSQELFPEESVLPEGFTPLHDSSSPGRARRRRARRTLVPLQSNERTALLGDLAKRAFPTVEFFLFALLCGTILGVAYLLDAPALLLLGVLLAPVLTPWFGLMLAVMTGSWRFFFQTLISLVIAGGIIVLTGTLAGLVGHFLESRLFFYADIYTHLWWPDLLVTALGAALLVISMVRMEQKPYLANILLAYGFFLPLNAAGVGLGLANHHLWSYGMQVFLVHLALATLVGGIFLAILRFRPARASGCFLTGLVGLAVAAALIFLTGLLPSTGLLTLLRHEVTTARYQPPTATTFPTIVATATLPNTPTATLTPKPTLTPSLTVTPEPTLSYAVIKAAWGGGAWLRSEPGMDSSKIVVLVDGTIVEVLPEIQDVDGISWVHIRIIDTKVEGWVQQGVLTAALETPTPAPTTTP